MPLMYSRVSDIHVSYETVLLYFATTILYPYNVHFNYSSMVHELYQK